MVEDKIKAKQESLILWRWLIDNPDKCKEEAWGSVADIILNNHNGCALCELFMYGYNEKKKIICSKECPLHSCLDDDSLYLNWSNSKEQSCLKETVEQAQKIYDEIARWKIT